MASTLLQEHVDSVKAAVSSPSTCTTATVVTLKKLLTPESLETNASKPKSTARATRTPAKPKTKSAPPTEETLSSKERTALATHVVNVTIKSLTEATKAKPAATSPKPTTSEEPTKTGGQRTLRRSISAPLSPAHARTLNRVATSPNVSSKATKSSASAAQSQSAQYSTTAECARVALACLRAAKGPVKEDQTDFQVETGMSTLAAKLLTLGLNELALKELRTLKRRLEGISSTDAESVEGSISSLIDFQGVISQHSLAMVATCQIQSLKLIAASRKPAHIEGVLPYLRDSHSLSPFNVLTKLARSSDANASKAARQLSALSQTLFSLAPSVSSSEDHTAMEPRLSPAPIIAFELQALAFKTQLAWWKLAGHQGKVDDEVLSPFSRCIRCFTRRQPSNHESAYPTIAAAVDEIMCLVRDQGYTPSSSATSPTATIYQLLGSVAHTAKQYDAAYRWYKDLRDLVVTTGEVSVRACSVLARLLAASLKRNNLDDTIDKLIEEVVEGMGAPLSGTASDINELLESLSAARRSVAGLLMNNWGSKCTISSSLMSLLKKFLLRYPRFVMRWLGTPPGKDASTKHILQFDQRRQSVMQSVSQVLDGTLTIIKSEIGTNVWEWQTLDDVLQDCISLLNNLQDSALPASKMELVSDYRVKISTLYFTMFSQVRKKPDQSKADKKQGLQALRRSIDAVSEGSAAEKERAQLPAKLEMLAELCKGVGRTEDASKSLRSICTNLVEEGVLSKIAAALGSQAPGLAWKSTEKATTLSRTLRSIARLDDAWNDWTFFLPETERAAVLEHLLQISTEEASQKEPLRLHDPGMAALLRIYTPDRYPIRRLRVLMKIYSQQIGGKENLRDINTLLDQSLRYLQKKDMVEDASLTHFVPHLRTYYSTITALGNLNSPFPVTTVQEAVSSWNSMVEGCVSEGDILLRIDEPEVLLDHLLAINQLAGLRGESHLQLSLLELSLKLAKACTGENIDELITHQCQLATQYISIGLFTEASKTLEEIKALIKQTGTTSSAAMADFYLSQAEYLAGIDDTKEAMVCVSKANSINASASSRSKSQATLALSQASLVQSNILLRTGDIQAALRSARSSVKWLSQDWSKFEGPAMHAATAQAGQSLAESVLGAAHPKAANTAFGPRLWALARPLFNSLMHLSSLYAHIGMYQETLYYCETASRIAEGSQSSLFIAQASVWAASIYVRAGLAEKAAGKLDDAAAHIPREACAARVELTRQLGEIYMRLEDEEKSSEYLRLAEEATRLIGKDKQPMEAESSQKMTTSAPTKTRATATARKAPVQRTTRAKAAPTTATRTRRAPASKAKAAPSSDASAMPKDIYQVSLLASVLLTRTMSFAEQKDWQSVASSLELVQSLPKVSGVQRQEQLMMASKDIGLSMEQMAQDPIFSIMNDSTISFPAILASTDKAGDDSSACKSPPRKGRSAAVGGKASKAKTIPAFAEALKRAQEILLDAHASALTNGDNATLQRISTLLQNTVISLTAASSPELKMAMQADSTTVAVELARNSTWKREQLAIQSAKPSAGDQEPSRATSPCDLTEKMANLGLSSDMARFQEDFIDLVPKKWSVISLSLSDNQGDLCITKFQAGHSPFILRLPLERANSRDADSEVFNFEHGREELLDIIKNANRTSHSGGELTTKASRNAWWEERESLDGRLKDLLAVMETTWLGGFKGIFSQHERHSELLARFQQSFHQLLNRSLPSRRAGGGRGRKATKPPAITLDPRILDLFIGLGDPTDPDCDFDEALNDLLYFVVDILQFHGEHNAYDEIDFDAMVVETYDALRGYYAAVKSESSEAGAHTILVLDKALHAFPWESMPCMDGLAVSRVSSLAALRRLITESRASVGAASAQEATEAIPSGHYVSSKQGTYMLNPSSDLKNTQSYFEPAFSSLKSWTGHVNKKPQEHEYEKALSESDILLYFGHGGGAQYIRGKTVRRLDKCTPATFLMGCSSVALTEAGDFEPYGPVWNYLMAGCPAVVGTLWDVTDRDIDRFAGRTFEEWGLFPRGTFKEDKKEKGKQRKEDNSPVRDVGTGYPVSLSESIARARGACRFKYLNAAAVVMYGIPVYIDGDA